MNEIQQKVEARHLRRNAYLYIRQSSLRQLTENAESTKRQYALRNRAVALGWPSERICVVDSDLGQSGASTEGREGFQKLVTEVGLGRAGIVMGLEVSRLARNCADWHRLLEICSITDTLILDEDGIYDPAQFNDRLLLGLKGTMSEAELHVIRARMQGGLLQKARRGELRVPLPVGFEYDDEGNVALDSDRQVRQSIRYFFETFRRVGTATGVAKAFREEGLSFPARPRRGHHNGELVFGPLVAYTALRILHNPRYAGAYCYGRQRYRKVVDGSRVREDVPADEWIALIPDAHPGYIPWEEYEENQRRLRENDIHSGMKDTRATPAREGKALLQGMVVCGQCGRRMWVRYRKVNGRTRWQYSCYHVKDQRCERRCVSVVGLWVDEAVSKLIVEVVNPASLEIAVEVQKELEARLDEADELRRQAVERAEHEAFMARRRFMRVDPDNRLVADVLEAEWNDKLRSLDQAREEYERQRKADRLLLDEKARKRVLKLAKDFPRLWSDPATPVREKKRMLRLLIEDVTVIKEEGYVLTHVRFKGGRTETVKARRPKNGWELVQTPPEVIAAIDELLDDHTPAEVATILNERGFRPGGCERWGAKRFHTKIVTRLIEVYGLVSRYDRMRARGLLTREEMMERLDISYCTLRKWVHWGVLQEVRALETTRLYVDPGPNPPRKGKVTRPTDRGHQVSHAHETAAVS